MKTTINISVDVKLKEWLNIHPEHQPSKIFSETVEKLKRRVISQRKYEAKHKKQRRMYNHERHTISKELRAIKKEEQKNMSPMELLELVGYKKGGAQTDQN